MILAMADKMPTQRKSHCPLCGAGRWAHILHHHKEVEHSDDDSGMWERTESYMLRCGGCKTVFFQEDTTFSEDMLPDGSLETTTKYFPPPVKRKRPDWFSPLDLDRGLYHLLGETYNALEVDARVLAATGARTVFDRASELLGVDPARTFQEKLDRLGADGHIGLLEREYLEILTDAGGAAAHRGWIPTPEQLNIVMQIVEAFIHRKFILEAQVKKLKTQIPPRQKRT